MARGLALKRTGIGTPARRSGRAEIQMLLPLLYSIIDQLLSHTITNQYVKGLAQVSKHITLQGEEEMISVLQNASQQDAIHSENFRGNIFVIYILWRRWQPNEVRAALGVLGLYREYPTMLLPISESDENLPEDVYTLIEGSSGEIRPCYCRKDHKQETSTAFW